MESFFGMNDRGMYFGIGKLTEETGELSEALAAYLTFQLVGRLQQLLGKAIAKPVGDHWDGKGPIRERLMEEIADVRAILLYFSYTNFTVEENYKMSGRVDEKLTKFNEWSLTGIPVDTIEP